MKFCYILEKLEGKFFVKKKKKKKKIFCEKFFTKKNGKLVF
jgi:hypothetical protein